MKGGVFLNIYIYFTYCCVFSDGQRDTIMLFEFSGSVLEYVCCLHGPFIIKKQIIFFLKMHVFVV